ncbi:MAG: acetyl-CoA carboxylase biotin carboxyl carrier protein subunit [Desulfobacteraceae bacterium]|nr:acetyl-CoA carboxylase biotin carboxyl carrier protein subunit [Desulfobacteraceae bacterium]
MSKEIVAPMPGLISKIFVTAGESVAQNKEVLILEAMKMENVIVANDSGKVKEIKVKQGDAVAVNQVLIVLE